MPLWKKLSVAAAILIIGFTGVLMFNQQRKTGEVVLAKNDIAPGKNGATLTLADGKQILINDALAGNIAEQSGVRISKTADGQLVYEVLDNGSGKLEYNTLSTTRGEQTQVRLPDGSVVFLNAVSSLRYPTSFKGMDKRLVSLIGEGYFEVAKDKANPFVVSTEGQQVEVLGTHFNINSYADEKVVRTTLLEGSVRVSPMNAGVLGGGSVLKPNQQASLIGGSLNVKPVEGEDIVAWKNGLFVFEAESLESIMRRVERWYDVEVSFGTGVDKNELYIGSVSRYDKVSRVLETIESTGGIHFKIEGRRIMVMK